MDKFVIFQFVTFHLQFVAFIDKLSRAMKLDEVAVEAGFDINSDAILLRAEQLSKSEVQFLKIKFAKFFNFHDSQITFLQHIDKTAKYSFVN